MTTTAPAAVAATELPTGGLLPVDYTHSELQRQAARTIVTEARNNHLDYFKKEELIDLMNALGMAPTTGTKAALWEEMEPVAEEIDALTKTEYEAVYNYARGLRWIKALPATIADSKAAVEKFAAQIVKDPTHALSWSSSVFVSAADGELAQKMLYTLEQGATLAELLKSLERDLYYASSSFNRSTSPTSNLLDDAKRVALAEAVKELRSALNIRLY